MLLIILCALIPAVVTLPSQVLSQRDSDHKIRIPYSLNCTSNPEEVVLQTASEHFSTLQSVQWPLLIGLQKSPVALCGHNDWVVLNAAVGTNASNSSFIASSTFFDSDKTLSTYLRTLNKVAKSNVTRRSLARRGAESIWADLALDGGDVECPPCELATTAKTIYDIGSFFFGSSSDDDPPSAPAEPSTCTVNSDETPLKMEPPDAPDDDDGPCKVSCEDCKMSFASNDQANLDGSFQGINVDGVKYAGTVVFECSGEGDKDYTLQLVKESNSIGGGVNIEECDIPDPSLGHEIDIDATLTGKYHVEGSGSFQFDFEIDTAAFQAQGNNAPTIPATTAEIDNFSGLLQGSYALSAEIDGAIKDITTLNGALLAGYGISAKGSVMVSGAGNVTAASSGGNVTATVNGGNASVTTSGGDPQATACMDDPTVDAAGKIWFSVLAAGADAADFDLWSGDMTVEQGDSVCSS